MGCGIVKGDSLTLLQLKCSMKIAKREIAKIDELWVERFWTVQVYRKKTYKKP